MRGRVQGRSGEMCKTKAGVQERYEIRKTILRGYLPSWRVLRITSYKGEGKIVSTQDGGKRIIRKKRASCPENCVRGYFL